MGEGRKEGFREGEGMTGQRKCMYLVYSQKRKHAHAIHTHTLHT